MSYRQQLADFQRKFQEIQNLTLSPQQLGALNRKEKQQGRTLPQLKIQRLNALTIPLPQQQLPNYPKITQKEEDQLLRDLGFPLSKLKFVIDDESAPKNLPTILTVRLQQQEEYQFSPQARQILFQKLQSQLPDGDYWAQAEYVLKLTKNKKSKYVTVTQSSATRVLPRLRTDYINHIIDDFILPYTVVNEYTQADIIELRIIIKTPRKPDQIISVRNLKVGNCVAHILKSGLTQEQQEKMFKALPDLKPTDRNPNPLITHDNITKLASVTKTRINVYTKLAAKLDLPPWHSFGSANKKSFNLQFSNGHANVCARSAEIHHIVYFTPDQVQTNYCNAPHYPKIATIRNFNDYLHTDEELLSTPHTIPDDVFLQNQKIDDLLQAKTRIKNEIYNLDRQNLTDVIDSAYTQPDKDGIITLKYYVRMINGENYLYKQLRPSLITKNPSDDLPGKFTYVTTTQQIYTQIFKDTFNLNPIQDPFIRNTVKSSEHFIGRKIFRRVSETTQQLDCNKCYTSYKASPFYQGFPTTLYPVTSFHPQARFLHVTMTNVPINYTLLTGYTTGPITIPRPTYDQLIALKTNITTLFSLVGPTQDIDINAFADQYYPNDHPDKKLFKNSLIGRLISGGLSEHRQLVIPYQDEAEHDQIIHECTLNDLQFSMDINLKTITVKYFQKSTGIFQFHSYILAYAQNLILAQMQSLTDQNFPITGYNVDSILYESHNDLSPIFDPNPQGGFKREPLKKYFETMLPVTFTQTFAPITPPTLTLVLPQNTLITGPPGCSKSYTIIKNPYYNQAIATPRHDLKNDHVDTIKKLNTNVPVYTLDKLYQPQLSHEQWLQLRKRSLIPPPFKVLIIDECFMFDRSKWDTIRQRATFDHTILIAIGDDKQIQASINGAPVTLDYFKDFKHIQQVRTPFARQNLRDGYILDSLRDLYPQPQQRRLSKFVKSIQSTPTLPNPIPFRSQNGNLQDTFITDNHTATNAMNKYAKNYAIVNKVAIPARQINKSSSGERKVVFVPPAYFDKIWFDRTQMTDEPPPLFAYEPAFAVTADSAQGKTLNETIYIDKKITRPGALYTAATRCRELSQVVLVDLEVPELTPNPKAPAKARKQKEKAPKKPKISLFGNVPIPEIDEPDEPVDGYTDPVEYDPEYK